LVADFTASDPQISAIKLDTPAGFNTGTEQIADKYDCFYLPYNAVPSVQLSALLNLDPFRAADKTFDKSDVVGNILSQLSRDNKTWGLPVIIEPAFLKYDAQQFDKAALPQPTGGWALDQFNDALKALKPDDKTPPPFIASGTGGTHLLILIAAYGGLPLDFRTDPPTINYSDQKNLDAIKQVLDLAKKGYIKYDEIGKVGFNFGLGGSSTAPIMNQTLNGFNFGGNNNVAQAATYRPVSYPTGNTYNAVSYSIGSLYISAKTQNAEGCYRWISTIAKNPDLFSAMPAYRSLINDPARAAIQGANVVALYNQIDKMLQAPNTVSIPSLFAGGGTGAQTGAFYQFWMFRAFDGYVLKGKDLEPGLQDAEAMSKALQGCVDALPPYDPTSNDSRIQYFKGYANCVVKIDPTFAPLFALINIK
jgi:ABC-type glycerol-3-phosphate transport system substrate-binding protein